MSIRVNEDLVQWQAILALFFGGFTTYSLIYCAQPLLPVFSEYFNVSPTIASSR